MTVRQCSVRLSMQSDVLNESNEIDCSASLPTTLIYSGLKLVRRRAKNVRKEFFAFLFQHPKPLVPTISMPSMTNPLSIVKTLSLGNEKSGDNSTTKNLTSSPSIRLVTSTSTTGKSSPPTALQFQFVDKSTNSNGTFSTSKTFFFNPQQTSSSTSSSSSNSNSSLVTLIPPGPTSSKIQTFLSATNELSNGNDLNHPNNKTTSFIGKNRLTLVQPLVTACSSSSSPSATNSTVTPKLLIQQNSTSNIWSPQSTTKIRKEQRRTTNRHFPFGFFSFSENDFSSRSTDSIRRPFDEPE